LYGVIVPILPFSLEDRIGVDTDKVQYWVSIALAVFGAALLAGSRKLTNIPLSSKESITYHGYNSCLGLSSR
jgi:hypothetical protein